MDPRKEKVQRQRIRQKAITMTISDMLETEDTLGVYVHIGPDGVIWAADAYEMHWLQ